MTVLAIALRHAVASTTAATWTHPVDPPAAGRVGIALRDAYQALQAAGDILISHTGPRVGLGAPHRPLTTEGAAALAGVGGPDNLALLARLADAAAAMDVRLARWLWPEEAPEAFQPLLTAAEHDAWLTRIGPLRNAARVVFASGQPQRAPVLGMLPAPPVDDPSRWSHPDSGPDCVAAIDAARSWLARHGGDLTVGQLADTARAALAISHYVGHVHLHFTHDAAGLTADLVAAARPWRGVLEAAGDLRSPVPARADHSTLTVAARGAEQWLRGRLRPDGQWLGPAVWASHPADRAAWQDTAGQITARMPDLADLLHQAIGMAHARGGVLAVTGGMAQRRGYLVHSPQWQRAPSRHGPYPILRTALTTAAARGRDLAGAVAVQPRPGLHDVRAARRQAYLSPPRPARLAGQWYPQRGGTAEPSAPPPAADTRSAGQRPSPPPQRPTRRTR